MAGPNRFGPAELASMPGTLLPPWTPNDSYVPAAGTVRTFLLIPKFDFWVASISMAMVTASAAADQLDLGVWDALTDTRLFSTGVVTDVMNQSLAAPPPRKAVLGPNWIRGGRPVRVEAFHLTADATTPGTVACARTTAASRVNQIAGNTLTRQLTQSFSSGAHSSLAAGNGTTSAVIPYIALHNT